MLKQLEFIDKEILFGLLRSCLPELFYISKVSSFQLRFIP